MGKVEALIRNYKGEQPKYPISYIIIFPLFVHKSNSKEIPVVSKEGDYVDVDTYARGGYDGSVN